jgi:hypothetical protein
MKWPVASGRWSVKTEREIRAIHRIRELSGVAGVRWSVKTERLGFVQAGHWPLDTGH